MTEEKKCALCDMEKATPDRIPACQRPATKQVRAIFAGQPEIIDICDWHYERCPENDKLPKDAILIPISSRAGLALREVEARKEEILQFFGIVQVKEYFCKGCGKSVVRTREDGLFGININGLDLMAFLAHLEGCAWRRTS